MGGSCVEHMPLSVSMSVLLKHPNDLGTMGSGTVALRSSWLMFFDLSPGHTGDIMSFPVIDLSFESHGLRM
jgi:hypothetical protein